MGEDAVFHIRPQMGFYLLVLLCMMKYSKLMLHMKSEDFSPLCSLSRCVTGQSGSGSSYELGEAHVCLEAWPCCSACASYSAPWESPEVLEAVKGKRSQCVQLADLLLPTKAVVLSLPNAVPCGC